MDKYRHIKLKRDSREHMYIQLFNAIRGLIEKNVIKSDDKLPPIRKLAELLDINNVTVVKAYDLLESKGYVYKKVGSGTFVSDKRMDSNFIATYEDGEEEIYKSLKLMDRGQIQIKDNMINFASATPTPELFPVEDFKDVLNEVLDRDKGLAFGYQASKGYYPLRESITKYLEAYNINTSVENIQIISGAQQGIDVISKALLNYGDTVIVESPTYTGAIATFKSRGVRIYEVPTNEEGIDLDVLEDYFKKHNPKLIYTMPNFHNPTGYSYSSQKKKRFLELAYKYNVIVIEDDYLSDLNFYTKENMTLKSMDNNENVIYIKSFSKIFMPGLRLGFLIVPLKLNNDILAAKHTSDISTSGLIQRAFDLYLRKDIWKKHIIYMKKIYKERFDTMIDSLEKLMPEEVLWGNPKGGINFWIGLPHGFSASELYTESINKNVVFVPGGVFYPSGKDNRFLRLSIAAVYPKDIEKGIEILSDTINKYIKKEDTNYLSKENSYKPIL
jgi:DNA-binding transcriptional MocR family regulator